MIVYGVTDAISSFVIGRVEVHIGRKLIFTAGGFVNLLVILWMLLWRAKEGVNQGYQLYLMAVGWGFSDAVWQTHISCKFRSVYLAVSSEKSSVMTMTFTNTFFMDIPNL